MSEHDPIQVQTQALASFMGGAIPRRFSPEERRQRLERAFRALSEDEFDMPEEESHPERILVHWRIARGVALITGICAEDEPLDAATEIEPSPWYNSLPVRLTPAQQKLIRRQEAAQVLGLASKGIPLLPGDDNEKGATHRWCEMACILANELGICNSDAGRAGLKGLLRAKTALHSGVTPKQVLALEELLIDEAQKSIVEYGERPTIEHFRNEYDFSRKEAIGLIRLARADALATGGSSVEEDRAIMVANLKDLIARCKQDMNSDREMKALKQLAAIQGLTRTEPEDRAADFMRVIAAVATRQDQTIEAPRARVLLAEKSQVLGRVVEYTGASSDDDEDTEAFDKEN